MKGYTGIIMLFIVGALINAGYKAFNSESVELEEEKNKLVIDEKLKGLGIVFLKENCQNLYRSEYSNFIENSDLYDLDFKYEFNDYLRNIAFKEDLYTQHGRYRKAFGNDEIKINDSLSMHCGDLEIDSSINFIRTSRIVGNHINLYNHGVLSFSNHISNLNKIQGIKINEFKFGHVELNKYSLMLDFSNHGYLRYIDFISIEKAENFSNKLSLLYDEHMQSKTYIESEK
jgi:hypothetical protein